MKKQPKAEPGHLKEGALVLEQTEKGRKKLSNRLRAFQALKRMPAPVLNWGKSWED